MLRRAGRLAWRPSPGRRSLGCSSVDAPTAAAIPEHQFTMTRDDHRSPRSADRGRGRRRAARSPATCFPAWPARLAGAARAARRRGSHARRTRLRAHLRRRPAPRRAPPRCSRCSPRAGARDVLPGRRAGAPQPGAGRARSLAAGHGDRAALRPPPQPAAARARARCARTSRARGRDRAAERPARSALYRPPYGVAQRGGAADRAPTAAGARCCGATGAATGSARATPSRSPRLVDACACAGARCCCCTTPTTTRRRVRGGAQSAALPRVLETLARAAGPRR